MKHSVILEYKRCRGCTTCIKNCPTEAVRVRSGKATILNERCIDCGKCIQVCPHKAVKSVSDSLDKLEQYKYRVALPDPVLYGQFQHLDDIDIVLSGLLEIGFQKVFETAKAAEILSDYARHAISSGETRVMPQISSACPTIMRLIRMRFPKLIPNIAATVTPVELAAILARREAEAETGLPPEEIGVFSIVPCSSQVTAAHSPEGAPEAGAGRRLRHSGHLPAPAGPHEGPPEGEAPLFGGHHGGGLGLLRGRVRRPAGRAVPGRGRH